MRNNFPIYILGTFLRGLITGCHGKISFCGPFLTFARTNGLVLKLCCRSVRVTREGGKQKWCKTTGCCVWPLSGIRSQNDLFWDILWLTSWHWFVLKSLYTTRSFWKGGKQCLCFLLKCTCTISSQIEIFLDRTGKGEWWGGRGEGGCTEAKMDGQCP